MIDFGHILEAAAAAVRYLPVTLFITIVSVLLGSLVGLSVALIRFYEVPVLSQLFSILVTIIRGIPIVLMLLAFYLFLSEWINFVAEESNWGFFFKDIDAVWIALIPFIITASVQASEAFRGSLHSISQGQFDAAKSVGLTTGQMLKRIILPQLVLIATPMLGNITISIMKATSLASLITVVEILMGAMITANTNYRFLESYIAAAVIYWLLSILIDQLTKYLENRQAYIVKGAVK